MVVLDLRLNMKASWLVGILLFLLFGCNAMSGWFAMAESQSSILAYFVTTSSATPLLLGSDLSCSSRGSAKLVLFIDIHL